MMYIHKYISESISLLRHLDNEPIRDVISGLGKLKREGGRLFILGVGGSAAHASHAVNDFRKICGIEAYAPTDNVSEITARTNDIGWDVVFKDYLEVSKLTSKDALMVFSVSGGNEIKSKNIALALNYANSVGASSYSIVGTDGGLTKKLSTVCIHIPQLYPDRDTPHTEGLCAVLWHLIVNHPELVQ